MGREKKRKGETDKEREREREREKEGRKEERKEKIKNGREKETLTDYNQIRGFTSLAYCIFQTPPPDIFSPKNKFL